MASVKFCFKCLVEKPIDEFYRHPKTCDGRLGKCKDCTRADVQINRRKKLDFYREYDRQRADNPRRVAARKAYQQTDAFKQSKVTANAEYNKRHPEKRAARLAVGNAVRDGRLVRQPCEVCGTSVDVEAHHDDYSRPLDVRWLCDAHHKAHHKALRAQQREAERTARASGKAA